MTIEQTMRDAEQALHDLLQVSGWIPDTADTWPSVDLAAWRGRKALHELAAYTGSDPYCTDDRENPPPGVAYDLKIEAS